MAKLFSYLCTGLFLLLGFLGYTYFGPSAHTRMLTKRALYRQHISPLFEKLFSFSGENSSVVAYLSSSKGDLTIRPQSELVFVPVRDGQPLYGGTLVSSGEDSYAKITLVDNSVLSLEASSTILLEAPLDGAFDKVITLKVLKGTLAANKETDSRVSVNIVTSQGVVKNVSAGKKTLVISQKKENFTKAWLSKSDKISRIHQEEAVELDELIGTVDESTDVKSLEKKLFVEKSMISARVRAASQKISAKTPEKEINLDDLAQFTSNLENQSQAKPETPVLAEVIGEKKPAIPEKIKIPPKIPIPQVAKKPEESSTSQDLATEFLEEMSKSMDFALEKSMMSEKRKAEGVKYASLNLENLGVEKVPALQSIKPKITSPVANQVGALDAAPLPGNLRSPATNLPSVEQKLTIKGSQPSVIGEIPKAKNKKRNILKLEDSNGLRSGLMTEYTSSGFGDTTQIALDGLMGNFIQSEKCPSALGTMKRVKRTYGNDLRAKTWIRRWLPVYRSSCSVGSESDDSPAE